MPAPLSRLTVGLAVVLSAVFVAQVVRHRRVLREERREGVLASLAQEGVLRLDRDWDGLEETLPATERPPGEVPRRHPYAGDLNVLGRVSLARLAGPVTSERGRAVLRAWLLGPADPGAATARQGAVRELARSPELRTEFALRGRVHGPQTLRGLDRLLVWAEGSVDPSTWPRLLAVAWVAPPFLFVGLIGYFVLGWLPWWVVPAGVHVWVLRKIGPRAREAFAESVPGGPPLRGLVPQLELLSGQRWGDPALASIADRLGCGEGAALASLRRLSGLLDYVEGRRNAFYAIVAPLLLLEVHLFLALERWRALHGGAARDWLEALGEWETLSALATLAHDHPDWAYPTFATDGAVELKGNALGHPLIPPSECVRNDVSVGPPGTFLFVTGSNMSGKSTLLRALGTNAVLAAAGAPVCAASLRLPPVRVYTSMRIEDSLEEGISLFMAELLRIKQVVEAAGSTDGAGRPVLYLIDEILHGTNTAERRIAARGVVRHLLGSGAIGAVSSHDLTLAEAPEIESAAQAVHFREEVGSADDAGAVLTFDFKLREGVATTRNALKLLEAVGLGELGVEAEGHGTDLPTEA